MTHADARYYRDDHPNRLPHVIEAFGEKVRLRSEKRAHAYLGDFQRGEA